MKKSKVNISHFDLLGYESVDRVTNFRGVVTNLSYDLYGCIQVIIQPPMNSDGEIPESRWFDVTRIEVIGKEPVIMLPNFESGYVSDGRKGASDKPQILSVPTK